MGEQDGLDRHRVTELPALRTDIASPGELSLILKKGESCRGSSLIWRDGGLSLQASFPCGVVLVWLLEAVWSDSDKSAPFSVAVLSAEPIVWASFLPHS